MFLISRPSLSDERSSEPASPEKLAAFGKMLLFGKTDLSIPMEPEGVNVGRAQCALCHMLVGERRATRCPNLVGVTLRSEGLTKGARYQKFSQIYGMGDPTTGIIPHATTGGEYLIESLYCPSCYVREKLGLPGTNDMQSGMPVMDQPPIRLTDVEIVAVVAYLQVADTFSFSKVTAKEDWEHYFNKKLPLSEEFLSFVTPPHTDMIAKPPLFPEDSPQRLIRKLRCNTCHAIPTIDPSLGRDGPLLALKSTAPQRLASAEYQLAKQQGSAHATTPREYVVESIVHPEAFIAPGYTNTMLKEFGHLIPPPALDKIVDFLLTLEVPPSKD